MTNELFMSLTKHSYRFNELFGLFFCQIKRKCNLHVVWSVNVYSVCALFVNKVGGGGIITGNA